MYKMLKLHESPYMKYDSFAYLLPSNNFIKSKNTVHLQLLVVFLLIFCFQTKPFDFLFLFFLRLYYTTTYRKKKEKKNNCTSKNIQLASRNNS